MDNSIDNLIASLLDDVTNKTTEMKEQIKKDIKKKVDEKIEKLHRKCGEIIVKNLLLIEVALTLLFLYDIFKDLFFVLKIVRLYNLFTFEMINFGFSEIFFIIRLIGIRNIMDIMGIEFEDILKFLFVIACFAGNALKDRLL